MIYAPQLVTHSSSDQLRCRERELASRAAHCLSLTINRMVKVADGFGSYNYSCDGRIYSQFHGGQVCTYNHCEYAAKYSESSTYHTLQHVQTAFWA